MKRGSYAAGYTIVEVMIVLAVSSLLFLVAANFINGKQAKQNFRAGVIEMSSRVSDLINQVSDGHYTDVRFNCHLTGNTYHFDQDRNKDSQGTSDQCVFLGKQIVPNSDNTKYDIVSVAGRRLNTSGKPATSLVEASPTAIKDGSFDLTQSFLVAQNLSLVSIAVDTNTVTNLGFLQGAPADGAGNYVSGSQSAQMVYSDTVPLISGTHVNVAKKAVICLTDGTNYAAIIIGTGSTLGSIGTGSGDLAPYTKYFGTTRCDNNPGLSA